MEFLRKFILKIVETVKILVATVIFLILTVIFFVPVALVLLIRKTLSECKRLRPSNLKRILTSSATMFAVDDVHTLPKVNITILLEINGIFSVEKVRQLFQERVIEKIDAEGNCFYPELKWYFDRWAGFLFWKEDVEFKLENHISSGNHLLESSADKNLASEQKAESPYTVSTPEDLNRLRELLAHKKWTRGRSPWELLVLPYGEKGVGGSRSKTVLVFRAHHALADGIGLFNLLCGDLAGCSRTCKITEGDRGVKKSSANWTKLALVPFQLHWQFCRQLVVYNDENMWKVPEEMLLRRVKSCVSQKIPFDTVKIIANHYGANVTSVLLAVISGGVRTCLIKAEKQMPQSMHAIMPIPANMDHRGNLRNYITYFYPTLAVGADSCAKRIKICDHYFKKSKTSSEPMVNAVIHKLAGSACIPFVKALQKNVNATILLSNFPGPESETLFDGAPVTGMSFSTATHGCGGISIALLSYNGYFTFTVTIDDAIPTDSTDLAQDLCLNMEKELMELRKSVDVESIV